MVGPKFCPKCHQLVDLPPMLRSGNVKVAGSIQLKCGRCRSPKAVIVLRQDDLPKPAEAAA